MRCFVSVTLVDRMTMYVLDNKVSGTPTSIPENELSNESELRKATGVVAEALEIAGPARLIRRSGRAKSKS